MALPPWSDLHFDLLEQVAIKLNEMEDFMAFRGVCTSWRGAAAKDKFVPERKLPLLMFPKNLDDNRHDFYSLLKRKITSILAVPESFKGKRCIGVGFGWIMEVAFSSGDISLVNPITCAQIKLPNIQTTASWMFMQMKATLSADPMKTRDFMVMMSVGPRNLGFWKNGDTKWTIIEVMTDADKMRGVKSICYLKHKFYATDERGNLWMWDPCKPNQTAELIEFTWVLSDLPRFYHRTYSCLVESSKGELLLITNDGCREAYHVDTVKREIREIVDLDGDAIFIDQNNNAVSVHAADFPSAVRANCIYCPEGGRLIRVANVELKTVYSEWLGDYSLYSNESPGIWLL